MTDDRPLRKRFWFWFTFHPNFLWKVKFTLRVSFGTPFKRWWISHLHDLLNFKKLSLSLFSVFVCSTISWIQLSVIPWKWFWRKEIHNRLWVWQISLLGELEFKKRIWVKLRDLGESWDFDLWVFGWGWDCNGKILWFWNGSKNGWVSRKQTWWVIECIN